MGGDKILKILKIKKLNLNIKFSLVVGSILLLFCIVYSVILYYYLKNQMLIEAEEKTKIIMSQIKAVGSYVRETLRPAMFSKLSELKAQDEFILEAMSTTHVSLQVMERFNKDDNNYRFARVSDNPMNPNNKSDETHQQLLTYFRTNYNPENPSSGLWKGIINSETGKQLIRVRPIIMEGGCLRCHGDPKNAPRELIKKYGTQGGFFWNVGDVIGVESVSLSIDYALADVKRIAIDTFFFGLSTLGVLFLALYSAFTHIVTKPLKALSDTFMRISEGKETLKKDVHTTNRTDEIGELTQSFSKLSRHLLEAEERLKQSAEIEKQMIKTEKLSSLGQLSAGVAHEINNPLGGIRLCFNNLISTPMDEETKKRHIEVINSGLNRIQEIVKQLLDFAKDSPLNQSLISLNDIVENVLKLTDYTISQKGIELVKSLCDKMPETLGDANKLEQVILNLVINAIQAMPEGGRLTINSWYDGEYCYVSVSDTGMGISDSISSRIFDPFFTTKGVKEGTGLGLTVSKSIVEQHGGSINFTSKREGTSFLVSLPFKKDDTSHTNS